MIPVARKNHAGTRIYYKTYPCLFYSKEFAKMPRHFLQLHKIEQEVIQFDDLNSKVPEQMKLWEKMIEKLRLRGDFLHNLQVLQCGGDLKILRRSIPIDDLTYKDYTPCTDCLGFVLKHELWRHTKSCQFCEKSESESKFGRIQAESEIVLYGSVKGFSNNHTDLCDDSVLTIMKRDFIYCKKR